MRFIPVFLLLAGLVQQQAPAEGSGLPGSRQYAVVEPPEGEPFLAVLMQQPTPEQRGSATWRPYEQADLRVLQLEQRRNLELAPKLPVRGPPGERDPLANEAIARWDLSQPAWLRIMKGHGENAQLESVPSQQVQSLRKQLRAHYRGSVARTAPRYLEEDLPDNLNFDSQEFLQRVVQAEQNLKQPRMFGRGPRPWMLNDVQVAMLDEVQNRIRRLAIYPPSHEYRDPTESIILRSRLGRYLGKGTPFDYALLLALRNVHDYQIAYYRKYGQEDVAVRSWSQAFPFRLRDRAAIMTENLLSHVRL